MKVWLGIWNSGPNTAHPDWREGDVILLYEEGRNGGKNGPPSGGETIFTWVSVDVADMAEAEALYGRDVGVPRARLDVAALKSKVDSDTAKLIDNMIKREPMDETDVIPHLDKMTVWDACADVNADKVPEWIK